MGSAHTWLQMANLPKALSVAMDSKSLQKEHAHVDTVILGF